MDISESKITMLCEHLINRGITSQKVLSAFKNIDRTLFVDDIFKSKAYDDSPLPIGYGQTISQPYIAAFMTQSLEIDTLHTPKILEIGTGSGFQAAVLAYMGCEVHTIETIGVLSDRAKVAIEKAGIKNNITFYVQDGTLGLKQQKPFDRIIVTAASPSINKHLLTQLKDGGTLVIPEGDKSVQILKKYSVKDGKVTVKNLDWCRFVPLIGENGWEQ